MRRSEGALSGSNGRSRVCGFLRSTIIQPTGIGQNFAVINNVGNPALQNETSESITLGAVIQLASELSLSIDYYSIHLSDMIAAQSVDSVYTQCFSQK